jgi:hypothetical protein
MLLRDLVFLAGVVFMTVIQIFSATPAGPHSEFEPMRYNSKKILLCLLFISTNLSSLVLQNEVDNVQRQEALGTSVSWIMGRSFSLDRMESHVPGALQPSQPQT